MIRVDGIEQGSWEWLMLKVGVFSASEFDRLLTPKTLKRSSQREDYIMQKAAEWYLSQPIVQDPVGWMSHGKEFEDEALRYWTFTTGKEVDRPAFIYMDERKVIGCSPDSMGLELKCPAPHTQVRRLLDGTLPDEYRLQVQGCMLVTGYEQWDFLSYSAAVHRGKALPNLLLPIERDEVVIARLREELESAAEDLQKAKEELADRWPVSSNVEVLGMAQR